MDFCRDLAAICSKKIELMGARVEKGWGDYEIMKRYCLLKGKRIDSSISYDVRYSNVMMNRLNTLSPSEREGVEEIEAALRDGVSLDERGSNGLSKTSVGSLDYLLNNFEIHHLHLQNKSKKLNRAKLLFLLIRDRVAYFIDVRLHPRADWLYVSLLEIIASNWPDLMPNVEVDCCKYDKDLPEDKTVFILKREVYPILVGKSVLMVMGNSSSGCPNSVISKVDCVLESLRMAERDLIDREAEVRQMAGLEGEGEKLDFHLRVEGGNFICYEEGLGIKIVLLSCSGWFGENEVI